MACYFKYTTGLIELFGKYKGEKNEQIGTLWWKTAVGLLA